MVGSTRGNVDVPATKPWRPYERSVEETVMAGPLAVRVAPEITTPLERTVSRWPATVMVIADGGALGRGVAMGMLLEPICRAEESRETTVLSIMKAGSPGT